MHVKPALPVLIYISIFFTKAATSKQWIAYHGLRNPDLKAVKWTDMLKLTIIL